MEGCLRGYHDIGGLPLGEIDVGQHDYAMWEKRVDAMLVLLSKKGVITVDELRWGIETLGADAYEKLSYYERWIASSPGHCWRAASSPPTSWAGTWPPPEASDERALQAGRPVMVRRADPIGHIRTPHYIRGKTGEIERLCGEFPNPEELAFGRSGLPRRPLYRVRFRQHAVWPDYRGAALDTVDSRDLRALAGACSARMTAHA